MNTTYPFTPGFKKSQVETGRLAAERFGPAKATVLRERCYDKLNVHEGLTADEVAELLGQSVLSVRPRVTELLRAGRIEACAERRKNKSGATAAVWRVKPQILVRLVQGGLL